jgi:hypothetical protein
VRRRVHLLLRALSVLGGIALGVWLSLPVEVPVSRGDTWASLGARCGLSAQEVRRANPGLRLQPGEAVRLPIPRWRCYVRRWGVERAFAGILATPTPAPARRIPAAVRTAAPSGPVERRDLAEQAFARINAARQAQGLPPLAWDEGLYQAALARAMDMWGRRYFSHNDPETGASLVPCPCGEVLTTGPAGKWDPVEAWRESAPHWSILMGGYHAGAVAVIWMPPRSWSLEGMSNPLPQMLAVGLVRR